MARYYVNKNAQPNGDHKVHPEDCPWLPAPHNRIDVGNHSSCRVAVIKAREYYSQVNGCKHCSPDCHTQ